MPSFTLGSNIGTFRKALSDKKGAFLGEARRELTVVNKAFIAKVQQTQMSYRRDQAPTLRGTRVQTGTLRRDWFEQAAIAQRSIKVKVWSTTPYAPVQELGGVFRRTKAFGKVVRPYWVQYHKRLRVGEAWEKNYPRAGAAAIDRAFVKVFGSSK
jgi:hypothetical protein